MADRSDCSGHQKDRTNHSLRHAVQCQQPVENQLHLYRLSKVKVNHCTRGCRQAQRHAGLHVKPSISTESLFVR